MTVWCVLDRSQRHDKILSESTFSSFKAIDSISKPAISLILQKPTSMLSPFADFHFLKVISRNIIDAFTSIFYLMISKSEIHFSKPCKNSYFQVRWCDMLYGSIMDLSGIVNFPCWGLYNVVFWVLVENSGDNTQMILVVVEQCLHRANNFMLLLLPCQQEGWKCTRSLEKIQPGEVTQTDQGTSHPIQSHVQQ